jgi:hypothetical protein
VAGARALIAKLAAFAAAAEGKAEDDQAQNCCETPLHI